MLIARLNLGSQAPNFDTHDPAQFIFYLLSFIYGNAEIGMKNDRTYKIRQRLFLPLARRPLGAGPVVSRITSWGSTVCLS